MVLLFFFSFLVDVRFWWRGPRCTCIARVRAGVGLSLGLVAMSLLKLLFDLPEAGGESNFTVEEQEELMAFEHNLDEHNLVENFALPATEDRFGFLQGAEGASLDPAAAAVNGGLVANGVEVGKDPVAMMEIVSSLENGHDVFGSSTIQNSAHVVALVNQEPDSLAKNAVSQKTLDTPAITTSEPVLVPVPEIMPATASLQPAIGSIQAGASTKKYDVSLKHQGSGKAVWVKV